MMSTNIYYVSQKVLFFLQGMLVAILVDDSTYSVFTFSKGIPILGFLQIFFSFDGGGRKQRTSSPVAKSV